MLYAEAYVAMCSLKLHTLLLTRLYVHLTGHVMCGLDDGNNNSDGCSPRTEIVIMYFIIFPFFFN